MNGITETVGAMMISTRPEWLLPWVVGLALVVLLGVGLVIGVVSVLAGKGRKQKVES